MNSAPIGRENCKRFQKWKSISDFRKIFPEIEKRCSTSVCIYIMIHTEVEQLFSISGKKYFTKVRNVFPLLESLAVLPN